MNAYGNTDVGRARKINQDYYYVSTKPIGNLPNVFIVADGMGGHNAGDVASREAIKWVIDTLHNGKGKDVISAMGEAINVANEQLNDLSAREPDLHGMGTTLVMATICNDTAYIANIGDSRLYLIDDGIRQITRDHSFVEEMVSLGKIAKEDARRHERKNVLTRALGVEKRIMADFFEIKFEKGSRILMCSDGLTNMVEDEEIRKIVSGEEHIQSAVDTLIKVANENGGMDNITSVLIEA